MNFDNFISVTCICVGILEILSLHLDMKMVKQVARVNNRNTVSADTVFLLLMRATCSTIFISKCKLKISNMPTQMQVTLIKLSKLISSPTNANQMLISYFPHITYSNI